MTGTPAKAPWHLVAVGVFAILFNAIGVFDFTMTMVQGTAYLASAGMSGDQIAHYHAMPMWMTMVWATGVFGAFIASILLLLRKALAYPVFVVSLAAFLMNLFYTYGLTNGGDLMGRQMAVTSAVIAALLIGFCCYARLMARRGVLG